MNDWSRLAVDPPTMQKLGPKKELPNTNTLSDMGYRARAYQEA
jgi:hypothetical protein